MLPFSKTVLDMLKESEQTCRRSGKLAEAPRSSERLREASGSFPKPSEAARSYTKETGFDTNSPCVARRLEEVCANKSSTKLRETPGSFGKLLKARRERGFRKLPEAFKKLGGREASFPQEAKGSRSSQSEKKAGPSENIVCAGGRP